MNLFAIHLLLAAGWAAVNGSFDLTTLVVGWVVAWIALWLVRPLYGPTDYFGRMASVLSLTLFFLHELVVSCVQVARAVLSPKLDFHPGIIGLPLEPASAFEITTVANMITLTPGTMTLDVSEDRSTLWVHVMFLEDSEQVREALKTGMEQRVHEVYRAW